MVGWTSPLGWIIPIILLVISLVVIVYNMVKKNEDVEFLYVYFIILLIFQIISLIVFGTYSEKSREDGETTASMWLSLWLLVATVSVLIIGGGIVGVITFLNWAFG